MRSYLAKPVLLIVSVAASLLVGELLVRLTSPQILKVSWNDRVYGVHAAKPNVAGRFSEPPFFDTWVQFNSQRFRADRDFAPVAAPGVTRIAFLGDSFVFGWGVNEPDCYPAVLERLLRQRGLRVEVMNAGIVGQSLGEKALWYRYAVAGFHPDVVLLQVLMDDVDSDVAAPLFDVKPDGSLIPRPQRAGPDRPGLFRRVIRSIPGYDYLGQHSHLINLTRVAVSIVESGKMERVLFETGQEEELARYRQDFVQHGIPLVCRELLWLDQLVRRHGSRLAVVFSPMQQEIYPDSTSIVAQTIWKSEVLRTAIKRTCEESGIAFYDLKKETAARAASSSVPIYLPSADGHPNALGYRVFATATADWLLRERILVAPPRSWSRKAG